MRAAALLLLALTSAGTLLRVRSIDTVIGLYGETIVVPCNNGTPPPEKLMFIKWKYEKDDNTAGDLLVKQAHKQEATVQATDDYAQRVSIAANSSLLITQGSLKDERVFTCMVVSAANLMEYPVTVLVYKKPSVPEITDKAQVLDKDKPTVLGTCVVKDANPAADITWTKNGQPLVADKKAILINPSVKLDPATGLSSTFSILQYTATKEDIGARFTCRSTHKLASQESAPETFSIHYPTENVNLQVLAEGPITEGDNVTLKCHADGNPPPRSFYFHIKGEKVLVADSDTYTLAAVTRDSAGKYQCSLVDNDKMEASRSLVVNYLDLSLSPTGRVVKRVGDSLVVRMEKNASSDVTVSWTKDGKAVPPPKFVKLTYADAGMYVCGITMASLTRRRSFDLVVEGKPMITRLSKQRTDDNRHKVLTCEAQAVPEPSVQWSVNATSEDSSYVNGKAIHKITVMAVANLTVTCSVSNKLGEDVKTINISSLIKEDSENGGSQEGAEDQAKLIVGIVVGLLIAAAVVGLIYWLYMKNSRQGSWKTNEKEMGTSEESKKLEENNHNV
ncbi:CD166 antigen homolog A [Lampris incognitus]|uniref:CD166 antigen homolog A n=1 Tax=Lampris incognitus TaxID=2546036 RepID=UPI0024B4A357|nr:CD166 antigen homolog A [Lampris incognitus]